MRDQSDRLDRTSCDVCIASLREDNKVESCRTASPYLVLHVERDWGEGVPGSDGHGASRCIYIWYGVNSSVLPTISQTKHTALRTSAVPPASTAAAVVNKNQTELHPAL